MHIYRDGSVNLHPHRLAIRAVQLDDEYFSDGSVLFSDEEDEEIFELAYH